MVAEPDVPSVLSSLLRLLYFTGSLRGMCELSTGSQEAASKIRQSTRLRTIGASRLFRGWVLIRRTWFTAKLLPIGLRAFTERTSSFTAVTDMRVLSVSSVDESTVSCGSKMFRSMLYIVCLPSNSTHKKTAKMTKMENETTASYSKQEWQQHSYCADVCQSKSSTDQQSGVCARLLPKISVKIQSVSPERYGANCGKMMRKSDQRSLHEDANRQREKWTNRQTNAGFTSRPWQRQWHCENNSTSVNSSWDDRPFMPLLLYTVNQSATTSTGHVIAFWITISLLAWLAGFSVLHT